MFHHSLTSAPSGFSLSVLSFKWQLDNSCGAMLLWGILLSGAAQYTCSAAQYPHLPRYQEHCDETCLRC